MNLSNSNKDKKDGGKVTEKVTEKLDSKSLQILSLLRGNPELTASDLAEKMCTSRKTISLRLKKLCDLGLAKRVGSYRKGRWEIV